VASLIGALSLKSAGCGANSDLDNEMTTSEGARCNTIEVVELELDDELPDARSPEDVLVAAVVPMLQLRWESGAEDLIESQTAVEDTMTEANVSVVYTGGAISWTDETLGNESEVWVTCFDHVDIPVDIVIDTADDALDVTWGGTLIVYYDAGSQIALELTAGPEFDVMPQALGLSVETQPDDAIDLSLNLDIRPAPVSGIFGGHVERSDGTGVAILPFRIAVFSE
jgi:hypothetical protein